MLPEQESLEIRPNTRYMAKITIYYGVDPEKLLSNYSVNISTGGVFIASNKMLPEGTVLTVKFNLPNSDAIIYGHARVAWLNAPDNIKKSSLPPGMGIQFISSEIYPVLSHFLETKNLVPTW